MDGHLLKGWTLLRKSHPYRTQPVSRGRWRCLRRSFDPRSGARVLPPEAHRLFHHRQCHETDDPARLQPGERGRNSPDHENRGNQRDSVTYSSTLVSSPVAESMINPLIRTSFGISGCSFSLRTVSCTEDSTDSKPPSQRSKSIPL